METFQPRPKQSQVLAYTGGRMGVSAVPGSGKTWTLSLLAAKLIAEGDFEDDQEVLVVTLVNSAVSNFAGRVARFVQERGLLPHVGYRVRTLHGLCARHRARASGAGGSVRRFPDHRRARGARDPARCRQRLAARASAKSRRYPPRRLEDAACRVAAPRPLARLRHHYRHQLHQAGQRPATDSRGSALPVG